jgi:hypothetical protein
MSEDHGRIALEITRLSMSSPFDGIRGESQVPCSGNQRYSRGLGLLAGPVCRLSDHRRPRAGLQASECAPACPTVGHSGIRHRTSHRLSSLAVCAFELPANRKVTSRWSMPFRPRVLQQKTIKKVVSRSGLVG